MDRNSNGEIRLKGKLRNYILTPVLLTILFAGLDVWMYFLNVAAGLLCSVFVAVYLVVVLLLYRRNQSVILNEMIDFATQYSTVQKRLLDEFEVPYAILDQNCRLMWMNQQFSEIAEKEKHYHKSVTGIFPQVNKDQVNKADHVNIKVYKDDRIYRASISKIYFSDMLKESHSIESSGYE